MDQLKTSLLDLLHILDDQDVPLILGGGYGLYLKQLHMAEIGETNTLIPPTAWPEARATNDLDLFLRPEIVTSAEHMRTIRNALDALDYAPIAGAEFMQFIHPNRVKVDLLAGPLSEFEHLAKRRTESRRVSPLQRVDLHAHRTDEALGYASGAARIEVAGLLSTGDRYASRIGSPPAFTYILMKLFAFRDRHEDAEKDYARHHALDLYRVVAMLTEPEFEQAKADAAAHTGNPKLIEARQIANEFFRESSSLGTLRLRENRAFSAHSTIAQFAAALFEIIS